MDLAKRQKLADILAGLAVGAAAIILLGLMLMGLVDACVGQADINAGAARQHQEGSR